MVCLMYSYYCGLSDMIVNFSTAGQNNDGTTGGVPYDIVGGAIGGVVTIIIVLLFLLVIGVVCVRKRNEKKRTCGKLFTYSIQVITVYDISW